MSDNVLAFSVLAIAILSGIYFFIRNTRKRFLAIIHQIERLEDYLEHKTPMLRFYKINFQDDYISFIIGTIKVTLVFLGRFFNNKQLVPTAVTFLRLTKFGHLANEMILLYLQTINTAEEFGTFYRILEGDNFDDDDVKSVLQQIISEEMVEQIKNWKPVVAEFSEVSG